MDPKRIAAIFNEWVRRYSENPSKFGEILDSEGKPATDYGEKCAACFLEIDSELPA